MRRLCSLAGERRRSYTERFPSLLEPLPSLHVPPAFHDDHQQSPTPRPPPHTEVTMLPNGVRIASQDIPGPMCCVGVTVAAGSVHETPSSAGAAHMLERLAFCETQNRGLGAIALSVEATGGKLGAAAGRERMFYRSFELPSHSELIQPSDLVAEAVDIAIKELTTIARPVTEAELNRAKKSMVSSVLQNLEYRKSHTEDIGRQILIDSSGKASQHFLDGIDEVTLNDIMSVAQKMLSSCPTMASWGHVHKLPTHEYVCKQIDSPPSDLMWALKNLIS